MLRRQKQPLDVLSFLDGDGEMATMIRERDWTDHPFGPIGSWPQSLRSALGICLQSAFPTAIYWGSELRLLYNDAWAPIAGPRHPDALGEPASEVWSDIWHVIEPQFSQLISTGEGLFVEDQLLPMRRYGYEEETYWNYSFTPIRGEDGAIAGVFNSGSETTQKVLAGRQMSFLLEVNEIFRSAATFRAARQMAIGMLGEFIGAQRVGLREIATDGDGGFPIDELWSAPGTEPIDAAMGLDKLGNSLADQLLQGKPVRIDDAARSSWFDDARTVLSGMNAAAAIALPWQAEGKTVAILFVHASESRVWNDFEVSTIEKVFDKIMLWAERARAADRERTMMREIDHRARNVLAVTQSIIRLTNADDVDTLRKTIEDRVAALARVHSLISSERWGPVGMTSLLQDELSPFISADSGRVRLDGPSIRLMPEQAQTMALLLHELVTNAAKHGALRTTGGKLSVTWKLDTDDQLRLDWVESETPFERPPPKSASSGFGSTLIARVIERQFAGKVSRDFTQDGIRYAFVIPLVHAPQARQAAETEKKAEQESRARTVLIVEDEPLVAMDLGAMVEELGYSILTTVSSVEEGLSQLKSRKPDFAILDANLRGESSMPVAEALSALSIPVIFSTGYAEIPDMPEDLSKAQILSKPISKEQLAQAIEQSLA